MPEVAFHFNASDKLVHCCRLLRKATASGARVVVTGPELLLAELDTMLWTFSALDFLPHARLGGASAAPHASTPILLTAQARPVPGFGVLVNLGDSVPLAFAGFERVIEVVTTDTADRHAARERWREYAQAGHPIVRHDLAGANP